VRIYFAHWKKEGEFCHSKNGIFIGFFTEVTLVPSTLVSSEKIASYGFDSFCAILKNPLKLA
jgi:hypothetical protein